MGLASLALLRAIYCGKRVQARPSGASYPSSDLAFSTRSLNKKSQKSGDRDNWLVAGKRS